MSEVLALSMLYEILVSESKYESRGIDYRTKLKALYHQLLKEHQSQNETNHKISKQSSNKLLECLSDSVKVLDPTQVQPTDLELCYGIHQYVFPKIPDFNTLDIRYVSKWNKFYNAFPEYSKLPERKSKRQSEKQKTYQMSKRRYTRESESSSESDESETTPDLPVLMTEEDFGNEESDTKSIKNEFDGLTKVEDPGANLPLDDEPEGHVKLPLVMNKDVEITEDSIVFGLMDDEKLTEWVSTSSMHNYDELYKEMYSCDPTLKCFLTQIKDSKPKEDTDAFDLLAKEANLDMNDGPEYDETGRAEYLTEDDTDDSFYFKDYKSDSSDGCDKTDSFETLSGVKTESIYSSSSTTNSEEMNEQLIGTSDFYKEVKVKTLPGNYKQNTEKFEVESIFGNYYCPVSSTTSDNAKDEQQGEFSAGPKKRGRPKKKPQTPSSTTLVDSIDKIDTLNSTTDLGIKSDNLEQMDLRDRIDQFERVDPSNIMNVKTFTVNFMEVESTYSCNNMGGFEVRCSARIKDPFVSGIMKGKMDPAMGVYQELQEMLKKLFSLKKKITGNCSVCSGWNLLHGIAQSFCEYCEDKLVNSDPELILKIFEIRRQLVSNLYPIVGYKFETLDLFEDGDLVNGWKELLNQQRVSIQSLTQVGASFPKASLHDSRFLPTPVTLPSTMCDTINSFQYPKSNLNLLPIQINLNALTKEELDIQVNTPTKNFPFSFPLTVNSYSCSSSYNETCSNSSKCGTVSLNDSFSFDTQDYSENTSRRLHSYGLMDIVNQRRYNRAKMFNDFFEDIYNAYHAKKNHRKSTQLINNYNNILKNGLLLSSRLIGPYTEPSDDENETESDYSSSAEPESDDTPSSNIRTRRSDRNNNSNDDKEKQKKKKKEKETNKNKEKNNKDNKIEEGNKIKEIEEKEKENYYDEEVSFVLSRLPLDTDMVKYSFYHRGVFLTKRSNSKSCIFVDIAKMFGFKEVLVPILDEYNKDNNYDNNEKEGKDKNKGNKTYEDDTFTTSSSGYSVSSKSSDDLMPTPNKYMDTDEQKNNVDQMLMTPDSVKERFGFSSESPFEDCVFTDPDYVNEFDLKLEDNNSNDKEKQKKKKKEKEGRETLEKENEEDTETESEDINNKNNETNKEDREEDKDNDRESSLNQLSSSRASEFGNMVFNYNWHEVLFRNLIKRPNLVDEEINKSKVLKEILDLDEDYVSDCLSEDDGFIDISEDPKYVEPSGYGDYNYMLSMDFKMESNNSDNSSNNSNNWDEEKYDVDMEENNNSNDDKENVEEDRNNNCDNNNEKEEETNKDVREEDKDNDRDEQESEDKNKHNNDITEERSQTERTSQYSNTSLENNENTGTLTNKKNPVNMQIMRMMYENGMLQNMPMCILNNLYNTGKLKIGFPTSLEMYMLNIPDSIMDCTMYGGVGKGFLYSLDTIVNNLSILSSVLRVGTVGNKRRKFSKT